MPIIEALIDPQGRLLRHRGGEVRVLRRLPDRMDLECPGQDVSRAFVLVTPWRPDGEAAAADAAVAVSPRPGVQEQLVIAVTAYYGVHLRIDNEPAEQDDGGLLDSLPCAGVRTREWYAWVDLVPQGASELHVQGQAEIPNTGVEPVLVARPRGGDPTILQLDFRMLQRPGSWAPIVRWWPLRYQRALDATPFRRVVVLCGEDLVADLAVDEVR